MNILRLSEKKAKELLNVMYSTRAGCSLGIRDRKILCLVCKILRLNFARSLKELCSFIIILLLLYTVLLLLQYYYS